MIGTTPTNSTDEEIDWEVDISPPEVTGKPQIKTAREASVDVPESDANAVIGTTPTNSTDEEIDWEVDISPPEVTGKPQIETAREASVDVPEPDANAVIGTTPTNSTDEEIDWEVDLSLPQVTEKSQIETANEASVDVPESDINAVEKPPEPSPPTNLEPHELSEGPVDLDDFDDLDDLPTFELEEDPEDFYDRSAGVSVSGAFTPFVSTTPANSNYEEIDWEIDLFPSPITGGGIISDAVISPNQGDEHGFLKVRRGGRQSRKRAVLQSGTRLYIDPDICLTWATEILKKRYFDSDDLDMLISFCEGNGDFDELRVNLLRALEVAGLESFEEASESNNTLWDVRSNISANELAEAIEVIFSRATLLPGTSQFNVNRSNKAVSLMVRAKQNLQLGILASKSAIQILLDEIDLLLDNLKTNVLLRPEHAKTEEFFMANEALKKWNSSGRAMNGRPRRIALEALNELGFSLMFLKKMVESLAKHKAYLEEYSRLNDLISAVEMAQEQLLLEHLPHARRFAARHVKDGEDTEDVFQMMFMSLQQTIYRFDLKLGSVTAYSMLLMNQALIRWRENEDAIVRIPAHLHQKVSAFAQAVEQFEARYACSPTTFELAAELGYNEKDIQMLLRIPRHCSNFDNSEQWEEVIPRTGQEDAPFYQAETARIISEVLTEIPERHADVIRRRFGLGFDEMTLEEIGQIYGVTRERIRQIENRGLRDLSHPTRAQRLWTLFRI